MDTAKLFNKKKDLDHMSETEAFSMLDKIADDMDIRVVGDDLEILKKELWKVVSTKNLVFDISDDSFKYVLKNPIKDRDGIVKISILKIQDCGMENKRGISKHRDDIDQGAALFSAFCRTDSDEEIPHGFLTRIKTRDQIIINAVIQGFFLEAVSDGKTIG